MRFFLLRSGICRILWLRNDAHHSAIDVTHRSVEFYVETKMRKLSLAMFATIFAIVCVGTLSSAADAPANRYAGTWNGTWEGGGTGRFDMTLAAGADGTMTGSVSVGTEGGDYTAKFTTLSFDGNKMHAKYNYPLDEQGEITVEGTFDAGKGMGTWGLGQKGQNGPALANGTWTVSKK
jgi:hypothetical protein